MAAKKSHVLSHDPSQILSTFIRLTVYNQTVLSLEQIFIIIGLILALIELLLGAATGFDLVIIGVVLILGGYVGSFFHNLYFTLGLTSILGIFYLWLGRSFIKQKLIVVTRHTNIDKLIGKKAIVTRSITPNTAGIIRVDDEDWRASSQDVLYEKDKVEILSIEGVTLIVKKA